MSDQLRQMSYKASTLQPANTGHVWDNKKEVNVNPRKNVPIHLGPIGAILEAGGACILAFNWVNKSVLSSPSSTFFSTCSKCS